MSKFHSVRTFPLLLLAFLIPATPVFSDSPYIQGKRAFAARNYDRALEHFRDALRLNPGNGDPYFYIGYILEYGENREEAIENYRRGVELRMDRDLREKALWKIILYYKYTRNWTGLLQYSEIFLKTYRSPEVEKLRDMARENQDPRIPRIQKLLSSAQEKEKQGDFSGARSDYNQALSLDSRLPTAHWKLALMDMKGEKNRNAATHLQNLIEMDPESWEYHYKLALALYRLGEYENSRDMLKKAIEKNHAPGRNFEFFTGLLSSLLSLEEHRPGEALEFYRSHPSTDNPILLGTAARASLEQGDLPAATDLAKKTLTASPTSSSALYTLYAIHLLQNRPEAALDSYRKFVSSLPQEFPGDRQLPPAFERIRLSAGVLYLQTEPEKGKELLEKEWDRVRDLPPAPQPVDTPFQPYRVHSTEFNPSREDVVFSLSDYYEKQKNYSRALYLLSYLDDTPWKQYRQARYQLENGNVSACKYTMRNLLSQAPSFLDETRKDPVFRSFAESDSEFHDLLFPPPPPEPESKNAEPNRVPDSAGPDNSIEKPAQESIEAGDPATSGANPSPAKTDSGKNQP